MKTTVYNYFTKEYSEITINHVYNTYTGYGHRKAYFEILFNDNNKEFYTISTDMEFFDRLSDENYSEWTNLYFEKFFDEIKDCIEEWVSEISETKETEETE